MLLYRSKMKKMFKLSNEIRLIVVDQNNKEGLIIGVKITANCNLNKIYFRKETKYIDLKTKIKYRIR